MENKILKATRTAANGTIEYDLDINNLVPVIENLKELGVDLELGEMVALIESKLLGKKIDTEGIVLYKQYTLLREKDRDYNILNAKTWEETLHIMRTKPLDVSLSEALGMKSKP